MKTNKQEKKTNEFFYDTFVKDKQENKHRFDQLVSFLI